jgi:hypothetical protein
MEHTSMILLETMVCSGVYHLQNGVSDRKFWTRLMRERSQLLLEEDQLNMMIAYPTG